LPYTFREYSAGGYLNGSSLLIICGRTSGLGPICPVTTGLFSASLSHAAAKATASASDMTEREFMSIKLPELGPVNEARDQVERLQRREIVWVRAPQLFDHRVCLL
jgi:hypothetical protein